MTTRPTRGVPPAPARQKLHFVTPVRGGGGVCGSRTRLVPSPMASRTSRGRGTWLRKPEGGGSTPSPYMHMHQLRTVRL